MRAIVLFSGGLDSTTLLYHVRALGHQVHSLTFDYEQRNAAEIEAARRIATALPVRSHGLAKIDAHLFSSALTSKGLPLATGRTAAEIAAGGPSPSYVPARNSIFLSMGLAWCESLRADAVFVGANADDAAGFPDCRPAFFEAFQELADVATLRRALISAPFLRMTKAEIVARGTELGVDYAATVSCYAQGLKEAVSAEGIREAAPPCRVCDACVLRAAAFSSCGIEDPAL